MGSVPRPVSPVWNGVGDDSADTIILAPELAEINRQVKSQRTLGTFGQSDKAADEGGPEIVTIKLKWRPHPLNPNQTSNLWSFRMKRVSFQLIFRQLGYSILFAYIC